MCMPATLKQHENVLGAIHEAAMADAVIDKEVKVFFVRAFVGFRVGPAGS